MLVAQQLASGCLPTKLHDSARTKPLLPAVSPQVRISSAFLRPSEVITFVADYAIDLLQTESQDQDIAKCEQTRHGVESEDTTSLCINEPASHRRRQPYTAHSLAVKAVERAQLRHKRRTHTCTSIEQHVPISDELASDGLWAAFAVSAVPQSFTQPRIDR